MSSKELFRKFLIKSISDLEGQAETCRELLKNYEEIYMKDSISQAAIRMSLHEATMSSEEERVLSYIRKARLISKPDLTTRFARMFDSRKLYNTGGIVKELIFKGMIKQIEDNSGRRERIFFRPIEIKGEESVTHIENFDSSSPVTAENLIESYESKSGRKRVTKELEFQDIGQAPSVSSVEDFEAIAERLKAKHFNSTIEDSQVGPCVACDTVFAGSGPCPNLYCSTNKEEES